MKPKQHSDGQPVTSPKELAIYLWQQAALNAAKDSKRTQGIE